MKRRDVAGAAALEVVNVTTLDISLQLSLWSLVFRAKKYVKPSKNFSLLILMVTSSPPVGGVRLPPTRSSSLTVTASVLLKFPEKSVLEYLIRKSEALVAVSKSSPGAMKWRLMAISFS